MGLSRLQGTLPLDGAGKAIMKAQAFRYEDATASDVEGTAGNLVSGELFLTTTPTQIVVPSNAFALIIRGNGWGSIKYGDNPYLDGGAAVSTNAFPQRGFKRGNMGVDIEIPCGAMASPTYRNVQGVSQNPVSLFDPIIYLAWEPTLSLQDQLQWNIAQALGAEIPNMEYQPSQGNANSNGCLVDFVFALTA